MGPFGYLVRHMSNADQRTEPRLTAVHVFAIGAGAMFSSGFFLLPGVASAETGPSLPLAYLLAGLLVLPTMLAVAELAVAMPRAGGPYHFVRRSLGPMMATVGGIGLWVALVLKAAFALVGIDTYLGLLIDLPQGAAGLALAAVFTVVNLAGARESAVLQVWLVGILLLVLGGFIVTGAVRASRPAEPAFVDRFSPLFTGGVFGLLAATAIVFVAFAGLPQVASVAADIRDPSHAIPRGILAALAVATVVYVLGTALVVLNVAPDDLRGDGTPIATTAERLAVPGAVVLVVIAALAAFASTGNAGIMSAARYPLALARDGIVWKRFARLNSRGVPVAGVVLSGAAVAMVVGLLDVGGIAKLGSAFVLVSFGLMNAAVIVLRGRRVPDYAPTFRVPWVPWLPGLGVITSVVLIIDLGLVPMIAVLGVAVTAMVWHRWARRGAVDRRGALTWSWGRTLVGLDDERLLELQEMGPRAEDRAPEALDEMEVVRIEPRATRRELETAASRAIATRHRVDPSDVLTWLTDARHPVVEVDGTSIHLLMFDGPVGPSVVIAWSPAATDADHRREGTVAVVATSDATDEACQRLFGLVVAQLADEDLDRHWPVSGRDVARLLSSDAARRQGGDQPPR